MPSGVPHETRVDAEETANSPRSIQLFWRQKLQACDSQESIAKNLTIVNVFSALQQFITKTIVVVSRT